MRALLSVEVRSSLTVYRAIAAIGGGLNYVHATSTRHAFSLQDPSISYPYKADTVSVPAVVLASVVGPGIITAVVSLVLIPGPAGSKGISSALVWRRKIWEWNTAWLGLALALASAFMTTEGLKDVAGKPRPHLLSVCDPDTSPESIARWRVGGLGGANLNTAIPIVVTWQICRTAGSTRLKGAFESFPSGHSSFIWSGMLYLSLFVCAKFGVAIPFMPKAQSSASYVSTFDERPSESFRKLHSSSSTQQATNGADREPRNRAAAPPVYLMLLALFPIGVAFYVAGSRWFDYHHHGFDIISGSLIGIIAAWFSFRLYHLPIRRGAGWAWGSRSRDRAFWMGVGVPNYVGDEGWDSAAVARKRADVEQGQGQDIEMKKPGKSSNQSSDQTTTEDGMGNEPYAQGAWQPATAASEGTQR